MSLDSSDPSDIANASRCFASCVPMGEQQALRTYLLTQFGNAVTPPCVTPTAPTSAGAKSIGNTTILMSWSQPPNSGSFIKNYIVYWGTTSGVYTNNSGLLPAMPRLYTISGLTTGTTYFWVVQAVAFSGCSSAVSSEKSATTTGSTTPPFLLNLASYWKLDEATGATRVDSVGSNNLDQGASTVSQTAAALINSAAQFVLGGDGLQKTSNSTLQFGAGASKSFAGWFYTTSISFVQTIAGKWNDAGGDREYLLFFSGAALRFRVRNLADNANVDVDSAVTIVAENYYHVAFGYDDANGVIWIQVDGEARVTTACTGVRSSSVQFRLGSAVDFSTLGTKGLDGFMDEWGLWNRVLTSTQVVQLSASFSLPGIQAGITVGTDNANRWNTKVQANGGAAVSAGTVSALANCIDAMVNGAVYNLVVSYNPIAPDNLIAARTPWSRKGNGALLWTNNGFVGGDLGVNGITGDAAAKYFDTGINLNAFSGQSFAYALYVYNVTSTGLDFGALDATAKGVDFGARFTDNLNYNRMGAAGNLINNAGINGFYLNTRVSSTDFRVFKATSLSAWAQYGATDAVAFASTFPSANLLVMAITLLPGQFGYSSDTISSVVIFNRGISSSEGQAVYNATQAMRVALGGGFR